MDIPYFLITAACMGTFVVAFSHWLKGNASKTAFVLLMPLFFCLVEVVYFGVPHHWSSLSLIGKLAAAYCSYLIPILTATFFLTVLPENWQKYTRSIFSLVVGIGFIAVSPMIDLVLICFFTGDCL